MPVTATASQSTQESVTRLAQNIDAQGHHYRWRNYLMHQHQEDESQGTIWALQPSNFGVPRVIVHEMQTTRVPQEGVTGWQHHFDVLAREKMDTLVHDAWNMPGNRSPQSNPFINANALLSTSFENLRAGLSHTLFTESGIMSPEARYTTAALLAAPFGKALGAFRTGTEGEMPSPKVVAIAQRLMTDVPQVARNCEVDVDGGVLSLECRSKDGWLFLAELEISGIITVYAVDETGNLVQDLPDTVTIDQFVQILRQH